MDSLIWYLVFLFLGYFSRDLYDWTKNKVTKGEIPRISINYSCSHDSTTSRTPRKYSFNCELIVKNTDVVPIYDIIVFKKDGKNKIVMVRKDCLFPDGRIFNKRRIVTQYGDQGNNPEEAKKLIAEHDREPTIIVKYQNRIRKNFKEEKSFKA